MTDELEDNLIATAEGAMDKKRNEKALEAAGELAALGANDPLAWFVKGKAHYFADQFEDALGCFSQAATIQNDRPEIWLMMGYSLIALRRYSEAIAPLEYVKAVQPQNVEATLALFTVHVLLGHSAAAKGYLEQAISSDAQGTSSMLDALNSDFIAPSEQVDAETKAKISKAIERIRIG